MSGAVIELIIFAAIAFILVSKLISILGQTSEEDKSVFGEDSKIKDVTNTDFTKKMKQKAEIIKPKFGKASSSMLKKIVVPSQLKEVETGLASILQKLPAFNIHKFVSNSKIAFEMILEATYKEDDEALEDLIDRRYLNEFSEKSSSYGAPGNLSKTEVLVSEIYTFGNNIFIKILFSGKNLTNNIENLQEEWTFTKSVLDSSPKWHLSNIDMVN